jgi:hypothetical protein
VGGDAAVAGRQPLDAPSPVVRVTLGRWLAGEEPVVARRSTAARGTTGDR